jgi:hypothetical protein
MMIAALAVTLTSCSRNPVAPTVDTTTTHEAGGAAVSFDPVDPPVVEGGTPNSRTVALAPSDEAVMTVGRFTLWMRKNSLKQNATVTLRVTDPEALEVEVVVSPAGANNFGSPVFLTANMSDVADFDYDTGTMMYLDGSWKQVADVSSHPNQQNVVGHFDNIGIVKVTNGGGKKTKTEL